MTDLAQQQAARLKKRNAAEKRFRLYGLGAIVIALTALFILMISLLSQGGTAFFTHEMTLDVVLDEAVIDPQNTRDPAIMARANYNKLVKTSLYAQFENVSSRREKRKLFGLVSGGAADSLRKLALNSPELIGQAVTLDVPVSDDVDMFLKGHIDRETPQENRRLNDRQIEWIDTLVADGKIERKFNTRFFTSGDSREPELAGIWGAVVGSFLTMVVTLALSFPVAVGAAIYLEEFAPKNRFTDVIEVNINNLAAVPSIVYGLLGLAIFLNFFGLPRSAPLVGGLVLALMTIPTIIIAARAALKSVPPSIREAALGIGASPMQSVFHHVLPLAMPGILTGTILGLARALGETAPLLMIGMVAFIVDIPGGIQEPASVLPVQIYLWVDSPERAFVEKTSAAILVLLGFLLLMNGIAIYLRKKFERRW
ncbi:MAG: phosphate ABC transporter permease PstA [Alphaproteobacteria bacterium]